MRIGIISPPWVSVPPPAYGGTEAVLDTLARGLQAAGHDVLLWTTGDSTCPVPTGWVFDRALGVGTAGAVASELRHVIAGYDAVKTCDVVHDHTLTGPVYVDRLPWLPVVTTNHGPFLSDLGPVYRAVSDRVPVIAISHHQASTAAEGVNLAAVIHHGVDVSTFPVGAGSGGYALFLGRMSPDKGVETAIRVARRAGVPLLIAAKMREPGEERYFAERIAPLLGSDVEYVGEVGGTDKVELLGAARCLLNPLAWPEPFGMVMIEAMACGTPVVATPYGAAPEIVTDGVTGLLASDEAGLARAVERVAELSRDACRTRVQEHFGVARLVADHLRVYRRIIDARRGDVRDSRPSFL